MTDAAVATGDIATLHELNHGYVRAAQDLDARWYGAQLHDAYMSFNPDGSLVDKAGYIERIARPGPPRRYEAVDAHIRVIGSLGIIQSGFRMFDPAGKPTGGCYTDVWSREGGPWKCISAHFALFGVAVRPDAPIAPEAANPGAQADREVLDSLNTHFISAVRESDAAWFESNLDRDFLNSNPDGSLAQRAAFIATIARPSAAPGLKAEDVRICVLGDTALIRARTRFTKPDGQPGHGRYTDLWIKRGDRWLCPAAHVTR